MNYYYTIQMTTTFDECGNARRVYGIAVCRSGNTVPDRIIPDIFRAHDAAEWFVNLINRLHLSPEQLDDAVADVVCA